MNLDVGWRIGVVLRQVNRTVTPWVEGTRVNREIDVTSNRCHRARCHRVARLRLEGNTSVHTTTAVVLVIVGALMLVCGAALTIMLYNLDFFTISLTSWYDVVIPMLIAIVGCVLLFVGARALRRARRVSG